GHALAGRVGAKLAERYAIALGDAILDAMGHVAAAGLGEILADYRLPDQFGGTTRRMVAVNDLQHRVWAVEVDQRGGVAAFDRGAQPVNGQSTCRHGRNLQVRVAREDAP